MPSFFSIIIGIFAIAIAVFLNYPSPPQSPLVHQWLSSGAYFTYKEFQIFYKDDTGTPINDNNETIVCLHGFPTSSFDWHKMWPLLKKKFARVILLDFLGLGFSSKPHFHDYSIFEQVDILEKLLKHLNVDTFHLISHDYGDTVAQEYLARRLEEEKSKFNVKSTCLLNGGIFPHIYKPLLIQKLLTSRFIGPILSKFVNFYVFEKSLGKTFGPDTKPTHIEYNDMWHIIRHSDGYKVLGRILRYMHEREENQDRWIGALQKSKVPIHMIYGPLDPINPPVFADTYQELIPKPDMTVLPGIGHYPQFESPEAVMKSYSKFLDKIKN